MASEDSEEVGSRFLAVHRRRDLSDVSEPLKREMMARIDELHALRKLLKVAPL